MRRLGYTNLRALLSCEAMISLSKAMLSLKHQHGKWLNPGTCAARQSTATAQRLLTYRWYPTSINTPDGRLIIISGQDLDTGTGCGARLISLGVPAHRTPEDCRRMQDSHARPLTTFH